MKLDREDLRVLEKELCDFDVVSYRVDQFIEYEVSIHNRHKYYLRIWVDDTDYRMWIQMDSTSVFGSGGLEFKRWYCLDTLEQVINSAYHNNALLRMHVTYSL